MGSQIWENSLRKISFFSNPPLKTEEYVISKLMSHKTFNDKMAKKKFLKSLLIVMFS